MSLRSGVPRAAAKGQRVTAGPVPCDWGGRRRAASELPVGCHQSMSPIIDTDSSAARSPDLREVAVAFVARFSGSQDGKRELDTQAVRCVDLADMTELERTEECADRTMVPTARSPTSSIWTRIADGPTNRCSSPRRSCPSRPSSPWPPRLEHRCESTGRPGPEDRDGPPAWTSSTGPNQSPDSAGRRPPRSGGGPTERHHAGSTKSIRPLFELAINRFDQNRVLRDARDLLLSRLAPGESERDRPEPVVARRRCSGAG